MSAGKVLLLALIGSVAPAARAAIVEFTVDPAQSRLKGFSGLAVNNSPANAVAQSPGSDETPFSGVIRLDLTADSVQFLPGTKLTAADQPGTSQPSDAPANFAFVAEPGPLGTPRAAIRDLSFALTSNLIPLRSGQFNNDFRIQAASGRADFSLGSTVGSDDFPGVLSGDSDPVSTLATSGDIQTLTLPFYTSLIFTIAEPNDSYVQINQTIVATRVVPEPGAVLPLTAMAWALRRQPSRRRRDA